MAGENFRNASAFPLEFPVLPGSTEPPAWTGTGFRIADRETAILSYHIGESGWTDDLTFFHEATAGEDHYIDRASRLHTMSELRRWLATDSPVLIDIGCSSGIMLRWLRKGFPHGSILGADYVRGPLESLAQDMPGVPLLQFDLTSCPLPDKSFDGVVLLNVLEHIDHDEAALAHVRRILKPNGIAIIEVPAGPHLYDVYDKLLLHHRRYRMTDLLRKVSQNGLQVLDRSHLGFFLYPPFWVTKKRNRRYLHSSEAVQKQIVSRNITTASSNPIMHHLMAVEATIRKLVYYPFGIRCLLTCRPA